MKKMIKKVLLRGLLIASVCIVMLTQVIFVSNNAISADLIKQAKQAQALASLNLPNNVIGGKRFYYLKNQNDYITLASFCSGGNETQGLNFCIENDITFTQAVKPIGTYSYPFRGYFDGKGKNIFNFTASGTGDRGFFGYLGDGAYIENLTIASGTITANSGNSAGAIAGYASGGSFKIKNCLNMGCKIEASSSSTACSTGGIIGYVADATKDFDPSCDVPDGSGREVLYCGNFAEVNNQAKGTENGGSATAGGLVGVGSDFSMFLCMNAGKITAGMGSSYNSYAGGIVGRVYGSYIEEVCNSGEVNAFSYRWTSVLHSGDKFKVVHNNQAIGDYASNNVNLDTGYNCSYVYYTSYAGGICGYIYKGKTDYSFYSDLYNCVNSGNIYCGPSTVTVTANVFASIIEQGRGSQCSMCGKLSPIKQQVYHGDHYVITTTKNINRGAGIAYCSPELTISTNALTIDASTQDPITPSYIYSIYYPLAVAQCPHGELIYDEERVPDVNNYGNPPIETYYVPYLSSTQEILNDYIERLDLSGIVSTNGKLSYCKEKFSNSFTKRSWETLTTAEITSEITDSNVSIGVKVIGLGSTWKNGVFGIGGAWKQSSSAFTSTTNICSYNWAYANLDDCINGTLKSSGVSTLPLSFYDDIWTINTQISKMPILKHFYWIENSVQPG